MLTDAKAIARKDLRIEAASRVLTAQVLPFGMLVLIMFGFGIPPDRRVLAAEGEASRSVLEQVAPGLFWLAVVFSALLAVNRSFAIEAVDGNLDALKMVGFDPVGVFIGKAAAVAAQLVALEIVIGIGAFLLYGPPLGDPVLMVTTVAATTLAIAFAGILYGALGAGQRLRDTLVPLLLLPVLAPVLLAATRATESALFGPSSDGWPWVGFLGAFSLLYLGAGIVSFGSLLEEA